MKKNGFRFLAPLLSVGLMLTACHHQTLEDRAEKECKDYTAQYCPTPYQGNTRTDSIGFNGASRTFNYYYLVNGKLADARIFTARHDTLRTILLSGLKEDTRNKAFKDKGYSFHYVFRSASTKKVLLDVIFHKKDYATIKKARK